MELSSDSFMVYDLWRLFSKQTISYCKRKKAISPPELLCKPTSDTGINECTRGIGDYSMKGGYKENEILRDATGEPVIATPDIFGPIPLSGIQGRFYILCHSLMSISLCITEKTCDSHCKSWTKYCHLKKVPML